MDERAAAKCAASFQELKEQSIDALELKLEIHRWWLEHYEEWSLEQDEGLLVIQSQARGRPITAEAEAQIIGSYNREDGTWLWAWANRSVAEDLTADALRVRRFGKSRGFDELTERKRNVDYHEAYALAAVASHICGSQGVFSAAVGDSVLYISFDDLHLEKTGVSRPGKSRPTSNGRPLGLLLGILAACSAIVILVVIAILAITWSGDHDKSVAQNTQSVAQPQGDPARVNAGPAELPEGAVANAQSIPPGKRVLAFWGGRWAPVNVIAADSTTEVRVWYLGSRRWRNFKHSVSDLRLVSDDELAQVHPKYNDGPIPDPGNPVTGPADLAAGTKFWTRAYDVWLPVEILSVLPNGKAKIRWQGFDPRWDEVRAITEIRFQ